MRSPFPSLDLARVEFALLLGIAIALPMFEGVKNILWGLYAAAWYWNRLRNGWSWQALGGRWDGWDTVLAVWLAGAVVNAAFAGIHGDEWRACRDTLRMTSLLWLKRSARPIMWIVVAIFAFGAVVAGFDTDMRRKQEFANESAYPLLNVRHPIWRQALATWRAYPAFGIGADNFDRVSADQIRQWQDARGERYEPTTFVATTHAHNLYLNTLAERGLFGLALLVLLFGAWGWSLACAVPQRGDPPL